MLYLVTGLPGNGKTYFTVAKASEILAHEGRTIYQHGIPELALDWPPTDPDTWYNLPEGSAIVIDEAQRVFPPMPPGSERPRKVRDLETHRHKGMDIWLMTQHPNLIDAHVRRLVQVHYHLHRPFGLKRANVWQWEQCQGDPTDYHAKKLAVKSSISFESKVWTKYKSATVHTVKRRLPWKLFLLPIAVVLAGVLAFIGWKTLRGSVETKRQEAAQAATVHAPAPVAATPRARHTERLRDRLEAEYPVLLNRPDTAPRYAAMTKPVAVPVVRGCFVKHVAIPPICWCVSQRGTRVETTREFCMDVVEHGRPFYDFEPDVRTDAPQDQPRVTPLEMIRREASMPDSVKEGPKLPTPLKAG